MDERGSWRLDTVRAELWETLHKYQALRPSSIVVPRNLIQYTMSKMSLHIFLKLIGAVYVYSGGIFENYFSTQGPSAVSI